MIRNADSFLTKLLFAFLASIFILMTVVFFTIPQSLGGNPGEERLMGSTLTAFHLT
jgi:hypothetical protein